jgi:hypothetical protein
MILVSSNYSTASGCFLQWYSAVQVDQSSFYDHPCTCAKGLQNISVINLRYGVQVMCSSKSVGGSEVMEDVPVLIKAMKKYDQPPEKQQE